MADQTFNEEYDVIVMGTGLKETILSGLLSVSGKKVLHMDRNDYYGAESASLNLKQLYQQCEEKDDPPKDAFGAWRDYSIDLCPKFIMGSGNMVKMLVSTQVTRYLDFKSIEGSYIYKEGKVREVPVTPKMVWDSKLMGLAEKKKFGDFLKWVMQLDKKDPDTFKTGWMGSKLDLRVSSNGCKITMQECFEHWGLSDYSRQFTGHAIALYTTDGYLNDRWATWPCLEKIKLYATSLMRFGTSPYIYPIWGLGGLPEGFSRLAAVHGGLYVLRNTAEEICYGDDGKVTSVKTPMGDVRLKKGGKVLADPSYFLDKVKKQGQIARWIFLMSEADARKVVPKGSAQIIIPGPDIGREFDTYVSIMNSSLSVAPKGYAIAAISSNVKSTTEEEQKQELKVAKSLIRHRTAKDPAGTKILKEFFIVSDIYEPNCDPQKDNVFVTSTMDATTHFQSTTMEVMEVYRAMTGKDVDLSARPEDAVTDA